MPRDRKEKVERLVLCSGKIYYDIDAATSGEETENVAIARVELLYPVRQGAARRADRQLPEPEGDRLGAGGAAEHGRLVVMQRRLPELLPEGVELGYVGRPPRASPGEGYPVAHPRSRSGSC